MSADGQDGAMWHMLQRSDALDEEMAAALAAEVPVTLWEPDRSVSPLRPRFREQARISAGSALRLRRFPMVRGYARLPERTRNRLGRLLAQRLLRHTVAPERSPLICTTSLYAPVAEHWPGPVVYWLTDLMQRYRSLDGQVVRGLDARLCRRATLVCPNSERIAAYLREEAGCTPEKVVVLPNAMRVQNLLPAPLTGPAAPPEGDDPLPHPVAGVIGNLAENLDWVFLERLLALTPWLHWLFVGPAHEAMRDGAQTRARAAVMSNPRTLFVGSRPHGQLVHYARAVSVAVLPYARREPTFSGSSTRFYEHLAAGHPILATRGVAELASKLPLLRLVDTAEEAAAALEELRAADFEDGLRALRWKVSRDNTWASRAGTLRAALAERTEPWAEPARLPEAKPIAAHEPAVPQEHHVPSLHQT